MKVYIKNKGKAFFSFAVCIFSFILLLLSLIEYEMLHAIFEVSKLEDFYQAKLKKGELLDNILDFERINIENFLKQYPEKTVFDYITRTKEGESLIKLEKEKASQGGYCIETNLPKAVERDTAKIYYIKYYKIVGHDYTYKVQILVEYGYGKKKEIHSFISQKLIEMRVYLS